MDIDIYSKNIELNSEAERYIHKKLNRLERHLRPITDAKLEITRTSSRSQTDRVIVQMTISANGHMLRGQETAPNLFIAVDAVTDVIDRQIHRFKGKSYRSEQSRKAAKAGMDIPPSIESEALVDGFDEPGSVVRTKCFSMQPMTVDRAITEMELLSHDFFLFYNLDSNQYNVVYRRRNGDYGVIEPVLA